MPPETEMDITDGSSIALGPKNVFKWIAKVVRQELFKVPEIVDKVLEKVDPAPDKSEEDLENCDEPAKKKARLEEDSSKDLTSLSTKDNSSQGFSKSPDGKVIKKFQAKLNTELSCTICNEIFIAVRRSSLY